MHKLLTDLKEYIEDFNKLNGLNFDIDSIRIEFSKEHKIRDLRELGQWKKINSNDRKILEKLKKRLTVDEVTTAYQLESHNIYHYNSKENNYRKATMVIFGLKQYHKEPPPLEMVEKILNILYRKSSKLKQNIDVCIDLITKPNILALKRVYSVKQYITKEGVFTDTYYINEPNIQGVEKITIYNKQKKNRLNFPLWRIEAKILIHNHKDIYLPLDDFQGVINIAKGLQ